MERKTFEKRKEKETDLEVSQASLSLLSSGLCQNYISSINKIILLHSIPVLQIRIGCGNHSKTTAILFDVSAEQIFSEFPPDQDWNPSMLLDFSPKNP